MAFVYDPDGVFAKRANPENITWDRVKSLHWADVLLDLVRRPFCQRAGGGLRAGSFGT